MFAFPWSIRKNRVYANIVVSRTCAGELGGHKSRVYDPSDPINATFEELLWRTALPGLFPTRRWLAAQWALLALCFGASHVHGTPGGIVGVGFAAIFGFAMFIIRDLSRGSVVWIIAVHFVADVILIGGLYGIYSQ